MHGCPIFTGDHRDLGHGLPVTAAQVRFNFGVHGVVCLCHKPFRAFYIRGGLCEEPFGELRCAGGVVEQSLHSGVGRVGGVRAFALPDAGREHCASRGVNAIRLTFTKFLALSLGLRGVLELRFGILGPHKRREQHRGEQALRPRVIATRQQRNPNVRYAQQRLGLVEHP